MSRSAGIWRKVMWHAIRRRRNVNWRLWLTSLKEVAQPSRLCGIADVLLHTHCSRLAASHA